MDPRRMRPKQKPKVIPMDRKIKPNPKYERVGPTIDTGNNVRKRLEKMQEASLYYRYRPDEIFRRIAVTSMVSLMLEQSKLEIQEEDEYMSRLSSAQAETPQAEETPRTDEDQVDSALEDSGSETKEEPEKPKEPEEQMIESVVFKGKMIKRLSSVQMFSKSVANLIQGVDLSDSDSDYGFRKVSNGSRTSGTSGTSSSCHHHDSSMAASTFMLPGAEDEVFKQELHRSVSEGHLLKTREPIEKKVIEKPYLLLDIRSPDEFEANHIVGAKNYHHVRLSRACNFETKEMLTYKNREGKLIIVYDYDELFASKFATTLIERGYDNVFMLSGGLRVAYIKFPERLITNTNNDLQTFSEDDILVIEEFLEEALNSGTSRMSTYAPSVASSRMARSGVNSRVSSSQTNLSRSVSPQKRHQLPFSGAPLKNPTKSFGFKNRS